MKVASTVYVVQEVVSRDIKENHDIAELQVFYDEKEAFDWADENTVMFYVYKREVK